MKIPGLAITLVCLLFSAQTFAQADLTDGILYLFPGPGAKYVHPNSTIIVRFRYISPEDMTNLETLIQGSGEIDRF